MFGLTSLNSGAAVSVRVCSTARRARSSQPEFPGSFQEIFDMLRFPERTLKLEAILMFALVFTGTLTWRVYACCETPPSLQSYHSCSHPPDVDCGSGMDCHHCLCNALVREAIPATDRITHAACSYGGQIKDFNHYSDATGWDNANLTGAC